VTWDLIEGGMEARALAYIVVAGEIDGGTFDWENMAWEKPSDS
jgi:hypothetical protein